MQINWKLKSFAFTIIDFFRIHGFLYFLQKHVTGRSSVEIGEVHENWRIHEANIKSLEAPRLFEFGAGKNLAQNIYLSRICQEQMVVDLNPMLDIEQVNESARQISKLDPDVKYIECTTRTDLEAAYSIRYLAPFDASDTGLPDDSLGLLHFDQHT